MSDPRRPISAIASSALIGWKDGKPRPPEDTSVSQFRNSKALNVGSEQVVAGVTEAHLYESNKRQPRPRSMNAPTPSSLVDYQQVQRNELDNLEAPNQKLESMILNNDEALKQFQYLEKSLLTFQDTAGQTASKLRQPAVIAESPGTVDLKGSDIASKQLGKKRQEETKILQGAPCIYVDNIMGGSQAFNALGNIYAEGDPEYADPHLQPLDPIIVEGEGYLYGIRSMQVVALKESVRGHDFVSVSSGPLHSMAITAAGQVISWGANDMMQLGYAGVEEGVLGIEMDPRHVVALSGSVVVHAACGKQHTIALTESGELWAWGSYVMGQLGIEVQREKFPHGHIPPTCITSFDSRAPRTVSCGYFHSVIVDGLGDLWSCGTAQHGAHGHEEERDELLVPQLLASVSGRDFRQVACGSYHTVALTATGELWVWGLNNYGQLGLSDRTNRSKPTLLPYSNGYSIRKICCGEAHSAFLSDREVYTFGDGTHGALGHGNSKCQLQPKVMVKMTLDCRVRDIECGPQYTVAISDLGQLYFWGNVRSISSRSAKYVFNMPRRFKGLEAIYAVAAGSHELTAIVRIPVAPPHKHTFKAGIFVEDAKSGVIDGYIGRACTWGKGDYGKLGHGSKHTQAYLKTPFPIYGSLYRYSVVVVGCGCDHAVCITDNGQIFTWGSNAEGQLGLGDTTRRAQPTLIEKCRDPDVPRVKNMANKIFKDLAIGEWHCLAITHKKKVYAWGKNKYGQLGLGNTKNSVIPTCILPLSDQLDPKNVRCIATGKSHSAVVGEDGDVYSWGRGWDGQLGHEVVTEIELEPRLVRSMEKLSCASIACGMAHTVAVTDTGNVWCWGDNKAGQLGNGTLTSSSVPVPVAALQEMEVVQVACGDEHTVVLTISNEVYGFGNGVFDQLGLGTLGVFPSPQRIPGLTAVSRIETLTCGPWSTAVLGADHTAYLLGLWDGLATSANFDLKKHTGTRVVKPKNGAGNPNLPCTTPDVLELPLGIEEIRGIALGRSFGVAIGLEEDRQYLIEQRILEEQAAKFKSEPGALDTEVAPEPTKAVKERGMVQQWLDPEKLTHGGDPFPSEFNEEKLNMAVTYENNRYDPDGLNDEDLEYDDMDGDEGASMVSSQSRSRSVTHSVASSAMRAESKFLAMDARDFVLGSDVKVLCWGNNQYGQLGMSGKGLDQKPVAAESLAKKPMNVPYKKVGIPPTPQVYAPPAHYPPTIVVDLQPVSQIACGEYHTIAVCRDGSLWTWGRNNCGQLGHGNCSDNYKIPTQVQGMATKISLLAAAGGQHSLVLTESNKVYAFGNNNFGQLGLGIKDKVVSRPDIVSSLRTSGVCAIACGYSHSIALLKNEQLYSWGRNDCGQLGLGHYIHSPVPEHVTALSAYTVQQIECGYDHCIAFVNEIRPSDLAKSVAGESVMGRNRVFTWGRGEEGQLGHQDNLSRCVPKFVETLEARSILQVKAGGFSSAAIDEAYQVYTWGYCKDGQLGHGDEINVTQPKIVAEPRFENETFEEQASHTSFRSRKIYVGPNYMLSEGLRAVDEAKYSDPMDNNVRLRKYSWGSNKFGQLGRPYENGTGSTTRVAIVNCPKEIPFFKNYEFKEISCGLEHVVALVDISRHPNLRKKSKDTGKAIVPPDADTKFELLWQDMKSLARGEEETAEFEIYDDNVDDYNEEEEGGMVLSRAQDAGGQDNFQIFERDKDYLTPIIERLGLHKKYMKIFEEHSISFDVFRVLKEDHLEQMGIESFGAKRRILRAIKEFNQQQKPKQGEENDGRETAPPQDPGTDMDAEYEARGWKIDVAQDGVKRIWIPPLYEKDDVDAFKEMSSVKGPPFLLHSADFLDKAADDDLDDAEYAVGTAGTEARGQPDQIDNGLGGVMDPIGGWAGRLWQPPGGN